jgi:hypothetical protein
MGFASLKACFLDRTPKIRSSRDQEKLFDFNLSFFFWNRLSC